MLILCLSYLSRWSFLFLCVRVDFVDPLLLLRRPREYRGGKEERFDVGVQG